MQALLHSISPSLEQTMASPRLGRGLLNTHRRVWVTFCGVTAPFSWVLVHTKFCLYPPRVCSPVLCKFWQLYGEVNGDVLHEGLCHTQVYCNQSPCLCSSPLLTLTSSGHSICGSNCSLPFSFVYPPSGTGPDLITSLPFLPSSTSIVLIVLVA